MRILASNPDTLGDLVLRQPLYSALLAAGHELTLIVRPSIAAMVRHVAPGAKLLEIPYEPYASDLCEHWPKFAQLFDAARAMSPDLLLIAPYRWTLFDERLITELREVPTAGMSGSLYRGDPYFGSPPVSQIRFDQIANVDIKLPEIEKNAALAEVLLGRKLDCASPRLTIDDSLRARGEELLKERGFEEGQFWVACVTGTAHVKLKVWQSQKWASLLSRWVEEKGRRFVFCGLTTEEPAIRAVQELMGSAGRSTACCTSGVEELDDLLALIASSQGYVGHDTGPMHIAAAMRKPVVAVFGGGDWPRFVPATEPSVAVTVKVPCSGCGWACDFEEAHCVSEVGIEQVWQAVVDLEEGKIAGREVRALEPPVDLLGRMIKTAVKVSDERLRQRGDFEQQLRKANLDRQALSEQVHSLGFVNGQLQAAISARESELSAQHERIDVLHGKLRGADEDRAHLSSQVKELQQEVQALRPKPWRTPRQIYLDWYIGERHYRSKLPPLPRMTILIPLRSDSDAAERTIKSILQQKTSHVQVLVVHDGTSKLVKKYIRDVDEVISPGTATQTQAIASGLTDARGEVLGILHPGQTLEGGAVEYVQEFFRRRLRDQALVGRDVIEEDGRKRSAGRPVIDVLSMLRAPAFPAHMVFFRKSAYESLGGLNCELNHVAEWDWHLRLIRRFGARISETHLRSISSGLPSPQMEQEWNAVREKSMRTFGPLGKARWNAVHSFGRLVKFRSDVSRAIALLIVDRVPLPASGANQSQEALDEAARCKAARILGTHQPRLSCLTVGVSKSTLQHGEEIESIEACPEELAMAIPIGLQLDLIVLGSVITQVADPLLVLRRLRQLLVPGGLLVLRAPNLKSRQADLFGSAWSGWRICKGQIPIDDKGVQKLAELVNMRVVRLSTASLVDSTMNTLIAGDACGPNQHRARRVVGWSRFLWDWRGRGDWHEIILQNQ